MSQNTPQNARFDDNLAYRVITQKPYVGRSDGSRITVRAYQDKHFGF